MEVSTLAKALAVNRLLFGAGFVLNPESGVAGWIGRRSARNDGAQLLTRAVGARDIALGAGALSALSNGNGNGKAKPWFAAHAVSDATDFVATWLADDIPAPRRAFGLVMAGGSAAIALAYMATRSD